MKRHIFKRILSIFCVFALIIPMMGSQLVFAEFNGLEESAGETGVTLSKVPANVRALVDTETPDEDLILPGDTLFEINTVHPDGTGTVEVFGVPVRYEDENGEMRFIDTGMKKHGLLDSLKEGYDYRNEANDFTVQFSKGAEKGYNFNGAFTVSPINESNAKSRNAVAGADENSDGRLTYPNAFGKKTSLEYINISLGVKENIILEENTGQNRFSFNWQSDTHIPVLSGDGKFIEIVSKDDPEQVDYRINPLYVYDSYAVPEDATELTDTSVRHFTYDCYYELVLQKNGSYIITYVISEEFFNNENTVYPVTIDPSVVLTQKKDNIEDAYVNQAAPNNNYGNASYLWFGYNASTQKKMFGYVKFRTLPNFMGSITSANIKLFSVTGAFNAYGRLHRANGSWSASNITWNHQPYGTSPSFKSNTYNLSFYDFTVTSLVKGWYSGEYPNYGFDFTYDSETHNAQNCVYGIYGSTDYAPKLTINYEIISNGTYFIKNVYSNRYLAVESTANGTNIVGRAFTGGKSMQWKVTGLDRDRFRLQSEYVLSPNPLRSIAINTSLNTAVIYNNDNVSTQKFSFIYASSGKYYMKPACSTTKVLEPSTSNPNIVLFDFTGGYDQQKWMLAHVAAIDYRGMATRTFTLKRIGTTTNNTTWEPIIASSIFSWNVSGAGVNIFNTSTSASPHTIEVASFNTTWRGYCLPNPTSGNITSSKIQINTNMVDNGSNSTNRDNYRKSTVAHEIGHLLWLQDDPPTTYNNTLMHGNRDRGTIFTPQNYYINNVKFWYN